MEEAQGGNQTAVDAGRIISELVTSAFEYAPARSCWTCGLECPATGRDLMTKARNIMTGGAECIGTEAEVSEFLQALSTD